MRAVGRFHLVSIAMVSLVLWSAHLAQASLSTARAVKYIKSTPHTNEALCERLTFWQDQPDLPDQARFHGTLQLVGYLRSDPDTQQDHEIAKRIQQNGETRYPAYLYAFCANDYSSQERDDLLSLIDQVTSPRDAEIVLDSLGSRNVDISDDVEVTIQFYEQLVRLAPTNQVGNARLSQLYGRIGQWESATPYAQATVRGPENTRFTLIGYAILSRALINRGLCQEAQNTVTDMWQRFENANNPLQYQALGTLSEAKALFIQSSCKWPNDLPGDES